MNIKRIADTLKLAAISFALSGAVFLWSPMTPASTVYAKDCNHEVFAWATLVKPTCSKAGKKVRICQDCEAALEAQIMSVTIVRDALGDMSDKQLNALVYDKVEPDLLWIRMNGSIVGAAVGFVIFLITAATGRLL